MEIKWSRYTVDKTYVAYTHTHTHIHTHTHVSRAAEEQAVGSHYR